MLQSKYLILSERWAIPAWNKCQQWIEWLHKWHIWRPRPNEECDWFSCWRRISDLQKARKNNLIHIHIIIMVSIGRRTLDYYVGKNRKAGRHHWWWCMEKKARISWRKGTAAVACQDGGYRSAMATAFSMPVALSSLGSGSGDLWAGFLTEERRWMLNRPLLRVLWCPLKADASAATAAPRSEVKEPPLVSYESIGTQWVMNSFLISASKHI